MSDKSQRTEKPTQRRIRKARDDGQFAVSREFLGSLQFAVFAGLLITQAPAAFRVLAELFRNMVAWALRSDLSVETLHQIAFYLAFEFGRSLALAGGAVVLCTLLFQLCQTGFGFSAKRLQPDLQRLNPLRKLRQTMQQNAPEFAKAAILLPLFCWIVFKIAEAELEVYLQLPLASVHQGIGVTGSSLKTLLWRAAGLFLVVGAVDFARTQFKYRRDLKMSRQEIRDELKEVEGHPILKARVRRMQRDLSRKQMLQEVPKATAVVVNPTHFAVAIRYDHGTMAAPRVIAKGLDHLALRIRRIAEENSVPVVENKVLAQALYRGAAVGQEIPPTLYKAVAEVLAFVYQRRQGIRL